MEEWTAAHLDVAPTTARYLVMTARSDHRPATPITFDRRVALIALDEAGATPTEIERHAEWDLAGLRSGELRRCIARPGVRSVRFWHAGTSG